MRERLPSLDVRGNHYHGGITAYCCQELFKHGIVGWWEKRKSTEVGSLMQMLCLGLNGSL